MWETWVRSLGWEDPLAKGKAPTPVFWPGEFHGLYSPWGCKETDMTEQLNWTELNWRHHEIVLFVAPQRGYSDNSISKRDTDGAPWRVWASEWVEVTQSCLTLCDPMEFSRPEYWRGQPFPSSGDLPNPEIEPRSPTLQAILYQLSHRYLVTKCIWSATLHSCVWICFRDACFGH